MPTALSAVYEEFYASPASLRSVVQHLLVLTVPGPVPVVRTILPNFQILLLINLGPEADIWFSDVPPQRLATTLVVGPLTTAVQYRLPARARVLVVTLTLSGFYQLFQVPAEHLRGGFIDPDALLDTAGAFAQLWERMQGASSLAQLGQLLADFCLPRVQSLRASRPSCWATSPFCSTPGP